MKLCQEINRLYIENGQRYSDYRIRLIEKEGPVTPRDLSEKLKVTVPVMIKWIRHREVLRC